MNAHKTGSVKERLRRPFCTGRRVTLVELGAGRLGRVAEDYQEHLNPDLKNVRPGSLSELNNIRVGVGRRRHKLPKCR